MRYNNWNKNKLREQIKSLKNSYSKSPTMEKAMYIEKLESLLNNRPNLFVPEIRFDDQVRVDKEIIRFNESFLPYIKDIAEYNDEFNIKRIPDLNELEIRNTVLLSFVHDFYNSFDREFSKCFNRIFRERHNNLRMTTNNQEGYKRNYMDYIPSLHYAYINIYLTNTVEDFTNLVHEYAHTIADQMKYRASYGRYPFIELLPLLMQEIALDEIIRCFDGLEFEVFKSDAFETKAVLKYAHEISIQDNYLTTENANLEKKQFISHLAQLTNNTKTKTERMLHTTLKEKISYVIPFLAMIELYDQMYKDKEKCIYNIKKIITMDECDDYLKYLDSLGIHIGEHTKDYVEEQKKILSLTNLM